MIQPKNPRNILALVRSVGTVLAAAVVLFHPIAESRSQSREINSTLSDLQSKRILVSEFDWELLNLNVNRAYEKHEDYSAHLITFDNRRQRFTTFFYVPANSAVLALPARDQIESFQVEMNGVLLLLHKSLDIPDTLVDKLALYIEADFVTNESSGFFVVARYRGGKIQLVHEKWKN